MSKIISFMHISLDGFVAGLNGALDWITVNQEIFDFVGTRVRETDTALYGRSTFQMMEGYWPTAGNKTTATKHEIEHATWYNNAKKIVLSTTLSASDFNNTTVINDALDDQLNEIKAQTTKDILLFGSPTATHTLLQHNLIDGFWLFLNPVILGVGIPLFKDNKQQLKLDLLSTHPFACGVIELNYLVNKS